MNIKGVPLTRLTGSTVDISVLLRFYFWQEVYYKQADCSFPSDLPESIGRIFGISEHCGHALTYKILTSDTQHIIYRSLVCPATPDDPNLRAGMFDGEDIDHNDSANDYVFKNRRDYVIMDKSEPTDTNKHGEQQPEPSTTRG